MSIFESVKADDIEAVRQLLDDDPKLAKQEEEYDGTPLHSARSPEMVRLLIGHGADVNARGFLQVTPLHKAADRGDLAVLKELLAAGAKFLKERDGETAWHDAKTGEIVEFLIDSCGFKVTDTNSTGETALHNAAFKGRIDAMEALIRHGADVNARSDQHTTPSHNAAHTGKLQALKLLMKHGADIAAVNDANLTPLCWAAMEGHIDCLRLLLDGGASFDPADTYLMPPIHWAAYRGHRDTVSLLLDAGADPARRGEGFATAYHKALQNEQLEVAELILERSSPEALGLTSGLQVGPPTTGFQLHSVRVHPTKNFAIGILNDGRIACWKLNKEPKISHWMQTPNSSVFDVAVSADDQLAVAATAHEVEIRDRKKLSVKARLSPGNVSHLTDEEWEEREMYVPDFSSVRYSAVDYSSDGKLLALADDFERIHLVDRESLQPCCLAEAEGGEWICCIRFSPNDRMLAAACNYQGGGFVELFRITNQNDEIKLEQMHHFQRSDDKTESSENADKVWHLAFPTNDRLALFETTECLPKPNGWIGNVVLFDTQNPQVLWSVPIDAKLTGDGRNLNESHAGKVYLTQIACWNDHIYCGARRGVIVQLDLRGEFIQRLQLGTEEDVLAFVQKDNRLWAATESGLYLFTNRA